MRRAFTGRTAPALILASLVVLGLGLALAAPGAGAVELRERASTRSWWDGVRDEWDEAWERAWEDEDRSDADEDWDADFYPRHRGRGRVLFRYADEGYEQVYIRGDFTDWDEEPMALDRRDGAWEIHLDLDAGLHHYQFVVEDADGRWTVFDPSNLDSERLREQGRVSVIDLDLRRESRRSRRYREFDRVERELEMDYDGREVGMNIGLDYQRVDGLVLGFAPMYVAEADFEPSVLGRLAYGFESERWSAGLTILQPLAVRNLLWLKLDGYAGTDFRDRTGITDIENLLATAIFREDFRDYFRREGVAFSLVFAGLDGLRLEGGIRSDDYESLGTVSDWSLANGDFAPNLPVDEGTLRSAFGSVRVGTSHNFLQVGYERAGEDVLGGFAEYELLEGTWRSRLPMGPRQHLDLRVKGGGNLRGRLPLQRRFLLGGLGTVRGFDYQSLLVTDPESDAPARYGGELMLLTNLEYGFQLFDDVDLFALYDAGMAYADREANLELDDLEQSAGLGFGLDDSGLRVDVMRPIDSGDGDTVVQLRLERSF